ncbi:hypothetical protein C8A01DRAFT_35025 [Parachaetomium inaequale]|uniref:Uncharacterized protein n=1 Tax=Parachaetomium inaequale TaxID=2588326 RepID=A0AAN6SS03_9PEZI|nr:hypothetical protein C8A01DRAFT_35025 [Parachaetomium inaequale]
MRVMLPPHANAVSRPQQGPAYKEVKRKRWYNHSARAQQGKTSKEKKCRWCRFRRIFLPWLEPHGSICIPPTTYRPDDLAGHSIDRSEWEVVQANFPGPLGRYYSPEDPEKPEVYMYTVPGRFRGLAPIPQYSPPGSGCNSNGGDSGASLPSYEWARLSSLPSPVVVDDSWPSLFAAQREKSRLLETQSYLSSRIAEIDRKVRAVMDTKQERDPDLQMRFVRAQMSGALHAAGLPDNCGRIVRDVIAGRPVDMSEAGWLSDLDKLFVLRERLSGLSLLSPPPAL